MKKHLYENYIKRLMLDAKKEFIKLGLFFHRQTILQTLIDHVFLFGTEGNFFILNIHIFPRNLSKQLASLSDR